MHFRIYTYLYHSWYVCKSKSLSWLHSAWPRPCSGEGTVRKAHFALHGINTACGVPASLFIAFQRTYVGRKVTTCEKIKTTWKGCEMMWKESVNEAIQNSCAAWMRHVLNPPGSHCLGPVGGHLREIVRKDQSVRIVLTKKCKKRIETIEMGSYDPLNHGLLRSQNDFATSICRMHSYAPAFLWSCGAVKFSAPVRDMSSLNTKRSSAGLDWMSPPSYWIEPVLNAESFGRKVLDKLHDICWSDNQVVLLLGD